MGSTVGRYRLDSFQYGSDVTGPVMRHLELIGAEEPVSSAVLEFVSNPAGYTSIVHSTGWPPGSGGAVAVVFCGEVYFDYWYDLGRVDQV